MIVTQTASDDDDILVWQGNTDDVEHAKFALPRGLFLLLTQ